ncbi:MAG TPA: type II toxin-antitoxin system Phd/YefM family antitoxin [Myxococcota bacterium]|nr:type II toxin-antitoxin system Phd/YefM family antitoxin [Myxococcota bacterium]
MKYSNQIKPISYLKAHAAELIREINKSGEPLIVTQNGEAKVVVQDITKYDQEQETLALLKILALGMRQVEEGKVVPFEEVFDELRADLEGRIE